MSDITIFKDNSGLFQVRTLKIYGEPWFLAKDVCETLELGNPSQAISRLDYDEKNTIILNEGIGNPEKSIVNESGLYSLVLGSRKPEAKAFKRWITHEVIPQIRKTGSYSVQPKSIEDLIILQAQSVKELKAKVDQQSHILEQQNKQLSVVNHRINNLDGINVQGDKRQRLNSMVRKYAMQEGIDFRKAWDEFKKAYNTAFRVNLTALKNNHEKRSGKLVTLPELLDIFGRLDDALRVADKMLNKEGKGQEQCEK